MRCSRRSSRTRRPASATSSTPNSRADDWQGVIALYKAKVEEELGKPFPQDPNEQLWGAIGAVFSSWMNARAITYRRLHDIPESWGTAVNVQAMVFGNMGDTLGHRRRLHPQSLDRRKEALRRVPGQCAGRGRRRRHPHAAEHHRSRPHRRRLRQAVAAEADAGGLRSPSSTISRQARKALPRHAGSRIHHRARQALDAADALRQAHRQGGAEDRRRDGRGRADHPGGGGAAHRSRPRSTSCCIRPSIRRPRAT